MIVIYVYVHIWLFLEDIIYTAQPDMIITL